MAKIATINTRTHLEGVKEIGDIVAIRDSKYVPTAAEAERFDWYDMPGFTILELSVELNNRKMEKANMWKDGDVWKELKDMPKFEQSIKSLSAEQIESLSSKTETVESKRLLLDMLCNRLKELSANNDEVNKEVISK